MLDRLSWRASSRKLHAFVLLCATAASLALFAPTTQANHNDQVLITAVYYDTTVSGEPDEAVRLLNPTATAVNLAGWKVCNDNGACAVFPAGASMAAGASVWVAKEADDFTAQWTFRPDFEMVETDAAVPNTSGGAPTYANSGEAVYLKDAGSAIIDMVVYGTASAAAGDPWSGGTVKTVSQGQLIHRAFDEALLDAAGTIHYLADTDTAADWQQGDEWRTAREFRQGQAFHGLPTWTVTGALTAYTSPDGTFGVLGDLVDNATTSIDIQIYEIESYQLYQKLSAALIRGVQVRLYLEGNPVGGMVDQIKWVAKELTKQGAQVMLITSSTGYQRYNFTHSKVGIIDGAKVFVQSENAGNTGSPMDPSYGNRGWGVAVEDAAVVAYFQNVFNTDWNPDSPDTYICQASGTDICTPAAGFVPDQTVGTGSYPHPYEPVTFNETYKITPVLSPDHPLLKSRAIREAFRGATKEILAEHMYLYKYWGPTTCNEADCPNLWLQDLIDAARRGVKVRVTLGAAFLDSSNPRDNTYTVEMLNTLAAQEGLDMEARLENLSESGLLKIHNKGFVIDGQKVFVSSINGSENSASENREAALLIENAKVAEFYRDAWHWLWNKGKDHTGAVQGVKHAVISEVMYDPAGTEADLEWVELHNPTAGALDLSGWKLQDNSGVWTIPGGTTLAAGGTMTVARNGAAFSGAYGVAAGLSGLTLSLANAADYVLLVDPAGNVMSKVAWGNAKPNWPLGTAEASTLTRCPVAQERFAKVDWQTGATPTPNVVSTACGGGGGGTAGHLLVSEVFYDTPGDDSKEEYVELYNPTNAAVSLGGWKLVDNTGTWTLPTGTSIGAGSYLVVARNSAGFSALFGYSPAVTGLTLSLGNTSDTVKLLDSTGAEVDMVAWGGHVAGWTVSAGTGASIHRAPSGTDTDAVADWTAGAPTPDAAP